MEEEEEKEKEESKYQMRSREASGELKYQMRNEWNGEFKRGVQNLSSMI